MSTHHVRGFDNEGGSYVASNRESRQCKDMSGWHRGMPAARAVIKKYVQSRVRLYGRAECNIVCPRFGQIALIQIKMVRTYILNGFCVEKGQ